MAAKIVQYSAIVIALLVLSVTVAQVYSCTEYYDEDGKTKQRQMLLGMFEKAIMSDSYALWKLQQIYFNPDFKHSPGQVCITVFVAVHTIANPLCACTNQNGPAFVFDELVTDPWHFNSYYELQLADDGSDHDTSELAKLMTESGSTSVFYTFDPSFYSIMKTLSSSIALALPYDDYDNDVPFYAEGHSYYYSNDYTGIDITISTKLDDMPCWDDAVYAMRSALMWVSFNCMST